MHWLEEANAHHLGDAAGVVSIRLVELCGERSLHVPGLDADDRKPGGGQAGIEMLR
jgi:hypothetical protein